MKTTPYKLYLTKLSRHAGNAVKQQQVGDNTIYHSRNPNTIAYVADHMLRNGIPSRYDLASVISQNKIEAAHASALDEKETRK